MIDNGDYEGLSLEDILRISASDNDNSTRLDEQAWASRMLTERVHDAIEQFDRALWAIGAGMTSQPDALPPGVDPGSGMVRMMMAVFAGRTADSARQQTVKLAEVTSDGGIGMDPQPGVMESITQSVRDNHSRLSELRDEREALLDLVDTDPADPRLTREYPAADGDPAALRRTIRDDFDRKARERMTDATDGYYDLANSLPTVATYDGPRVADPESSTGEDPGPGGTGHYSRPGPTLSSSGASPAGSVVPSPPATPPSVPGGGPILSSPGLPGIPVTTVPSGPVPSVPPGVPASGAAPYLPSRPVVPPVIGGRGSVPPGRPSVPPGRSPVGPPRGGSTGGTGRFGGDRPVTRPVIGQRGTAGTSGRDSVGRTGNRSVPPRPGGRDGAGRGTGRSLPTGRGSGTGAAGRRAIGPGVRARPLRGTVPGEPMVEPTARTEPAARTGRPPARITRTPRVRHGGNETVNRPVIGSRSANAAARSGGGKSVEDREERNASAAVENSEWVGTTGTVRPVITADRVADRMDYDPGSYLSRTNLGKDRWGNPKS